MQARSRTQANRTKLMFQIVPPVQTMAIRGIERPMMQAKSRSQATWIDPMFTSVPPVQTLVIQGPGRPTMGAVEALRPKPTTMDKKTNFWNLYKTLADEHDRDFLQKYSTDLDTSLIFAGLFSAVSSAFIIQIQPEIQPHNTLRVTLVAQCLLYVSLCSTLLAALLAVLGKQWLMYYSAAGERGTVEARGLERQRKLDGLRSWKFDMVLQMFPLLLQFGLLVFATALSVYLWTIHLALAIIVISFTAFGFVSYIFLLFSAIVFPDSPFQTPLAPLVLGLIPTGPVEKLKMIYIWATSHLQQFINDLGTTCSPYISYSRTVLPLFFQSKTPETQHSTEPLSLFDAPFSETSPEASAILWTLETSTDPHMIDVAAELVVMVQWPKTADVRSQLNRLYDSFLSSLAYQKTPHVIHLQGVLNEIRAIHLGRAYGVLCCVAQAAQSQYIKQGKIFKANWFEVDSELENVVKVIGGEANVVWNSDLAPQWALQIMPTFKPLGVQTIEHFLQCFEDMIPGHLNIRSFTDYLFCLNTFICTVGWTRGENSFIRKTIS
ncbi:hypothetical protein DFH06DRAFT_1124966 [Mycena polygramma]|nr:hypothetical protein DFH06DRAFT_1124966 [Mycena polygramma]